MKGRSVALVIITELIPGFLFLLVLAIGFAYFLFFVNVNKITLLFWPKQHNCTLFRATK